MNRFSALGAVSAAAGMLLTSQTLPANADEISDFYKGKRMTMLIGLSVGGGYDRYARLTARYLQKYIPGNPSIIAKNMTGGGSLVMANYVYNVSKQDGTVIAAPLRSVPVDTIVTGKASKLKMDPLKANWLGSLNRETSIAIAWAGHGIKTVEDLYKKEFIVGGTGVISDSVTAAHMLRNLLGMKFRVIAGYPGGSEINLAADRGEVMGRSTHSWSALLSGPNSKRYQAGKIHILYQMGAKKNPDPRLKDVPWAVDLAKDERTRKILFLKFAMNEFGYPYFMGPKVPKARFAAVSEAFKKVSTDPQLAADMKKSKMELAPIYHEEMTALLKDIFSYPPDIVEALQKASQPPGKVEIVKLPVITAKGKLTKVGGKGKKLSFAGTSEKGEKVKARLSVKGKKTKITVGGKKAKASDLKSGMACTVTYKGRTPSAIACM
jgi:tripartite-type tricarboxylate transporter receptor subunit TctC